MNLNLDGKRVFITASSDGIGRAIADSFLAEGSKVIINGRNEIKLNQTVSELQASYGLSKVCGIVGDMSAKNDICDAQIQIKDIFGGVDILIGNLGTGKPISDSRLDLSEWTHMIEKNLLSSVNLVRTFISMLEENVSSSIVLISSLAAFEKIGAPPAYAAAKSGIASFIKYMADDFAGKGIRINGISPGNVFYAGGRWDEISSKDYEKTQQYIEDAVPMKRFGKPEEIADAVVFLASERASFITGTILKVDGGQGRTY